MTSDQLRLGDQPTTPVETARPFLTDAVIVERLAAVEDQLREIIRRGDLRPFVICGRCADELHALARDLLPEGVER